MLSRSLIGLISRRFDVNNWEGGRLPEAGDIASFPRAFYEFNQDTCLAQQSDSCPRGGVILISPPPGATSAATVMSKLVLPKHGAFFLGPRAKLYFSQQPATTSTVFKVHNTDFRCAANWVVSNTTDNPKFRVPCQNDTAHFPKVCCDCD